MSLIALGVTGGIGAYKAVEVARGLQKRGHDVAAVMTRSARRFVGELTFEAITRRPVITSQFAPGANSDIEHISLASDIGLLLVAPATANIIGKFAAGIADDFLTALYLATRAPVLLAPAMNTNMLEHEAVRANLATLGARGVRFVDPGAGYLACGWIGKGRLAEPDDIVEAADQILKPSGSLLGRLVVVTAGPTYEDIDDVQYIGNRSSGKMGCRRGGSGATWRPRHSRFRSVVIGSAGRRGAGSSAERRADEHGRAAQCNGRRHRRDGRRGGRLRPDAARQERSRKATPRSNCRWSERATFLPN